MVNDLDLAKFQPILVNENMEVIDGQHRLEALRELGESVYYIVADGLRLGDVQTLNTLSRNWGPIDYAKSYIETGNKDHQHYLDIKAKYHFNHRVILAYIYGDAGNHNDQFKNGELKAPNIKATYSLLDKLAEVGAYYDRYTSNPFALAYMRIAQHPDYDHNRMLSKMRLRGHLIEDYSLQEDYQRALEAVYNFRMNKDRVRFF